MSVMKISWLSGFVLLGVLCSCKRQPQEQEQEDTSNRIYFAFDLQDRKLVIPVQLNDSVTVKLTFDTGDGGGYYNEVITLDTGVLSSNPSLPQNHIRAIRPWRIGWSEQRVQATFYDSMELKLKMGQTDIVYSGIESLPYKTYMYSNVADGMFNIPQSDTTHVWELNFENNYMEVHPADNYRLPEDCMILPLEEEGRHGPFHITFPLKLCFSDKDTLAIHQKFYIDTGLPRDIVLLLGAQEQEYLHQREDAVWLYAGRHIRYYTATGTLFDDLRLDSLRIYTLDYKNRVHHPYLIGLNFLKRFNCFFDMKNRRLGLQPLRSFERLVNPLYKRFHFSTQKNKDGRFIVDCVADYKENSYKTAGLQVGDEIIAMDGVPCEEITEEIDQRLRELDTLVVDIVHNGKSLTLYVEVDHNEPTGD